MNIDNVLKELEESGNTVAFITKEALVAIREAVEKQIPKEPEESFGRWPDGRKRTYILCPECHEDVSNDCRYCDECGQRIR